MTELCIQHFSVLNRLGILFASHCKPLLPRPLALPFNIAQMRAYILNACNPPHRWLRQILNGAVPYTTFPLLQLS